MYHQILVPVDIGAPGFADQAVAEAAWYARQSGGEIHMLAVVSGIHLGMVASYFPKNVESKMEQATLLQLNTFAKQHVNADIHYRTHVAEGKPYQVILDHIKQLSIDLVIIPSHKRLGIQSLLLGSVTDKVVHYSPVNVLVIKPTGARISDCR